MGGKWGVPLGLTGESRCVPAGAAHLCFPQQVLQIAGLVVAGPEGGGAGPKSSAGGCHVFVGHPHRWRPSHWFLHMPLGTHVLAFGKSGGFLKWEAGRKLGRDGIFVCNCLSFQDLFLTCVSIFLSVCLCTTCYVPGDSKRPGEGRDSVHAGVGVPDTVSCHMGAGDQTRSSVTAGESPQGHLSSPQLYHCQKQVGEWG